MLDYIALPSIDELVFAGGTSGVWGSGPYFSTNSEGASATGGTPFWTHTYYRWIKKAGSSQGAHVGSVASNDSLGVNLNSSPASNSLAVRPVISLKSTVKVSGGNGTASNPYTVE